MRFPATAAVLACVGALVVSACAQSGYDAQKLQTELVRAGATVEQARCVTNRMENTFDLHELGTHGEPTSTEIDTTRRLLVACNVNLSPRR